jgi:hypothetical protein
MRHAFIVAVLLAVASKAMGQSPVGQIFASDATVKGSVELAAGGARVMSGSWVSAGESTAILKLDRGGEVRVCPRTTLSVATSQSGRDMMFGLSVGGIETHYTVSAAADSIVTPDFRILLAGPGRFDFAIEAGKSGDTCVRALANNASSLIVSELMGDATYQVKPDEQVVFHNGRLATAEHANVNCGCVAAAPVMRAAENPPEPKPESHPSNSSQGAPADSHPSNISQGGAPAHVEVDAPFVFHADEPGPSPLEGAVTLHVAHKPLQLVVLGPPVADEAERANVRQPGVEKAANKAKESRFFGRVKAFFAMLFR